MCVSFLLELLSAKGARGKFDCLGFPHGRQQQQIMIWKRKSERTLWTGFLRMMCVLVKLPGQVCRAMCS